MTDTTDLVKAARAAEQAAYAAGTHLQASRSRLAETLLTGQAPADVAMEIHTEGDELIREVIGKHFPLHGFAGDEPGDRRPVWHVEAIDGLANYLRGYPQYAVTIALVEGGEPQIGVVYDPCRNEFFGAIRGRGAVMNGAPIRCAKRAVALESLAATVFPPPSSPRMPQYMAELGRVLRGFGGVRRSGSMALEMAYLAAGRIDAFWQHDLDAGSAAAGAALLRESGALVNPRDARPLAQSTALMACTPPLFEPFLSLLVEP